MAPKTTPEQSARDFESAGDHCERKIVDFSHRNVRIAVTPQQLAIVKAASAMRALFDEWPTSRQLAVAADVTWPVLVEELRALERVGVIAWPNRSSRDGAGTVARVEVIREPDGLFLAAYISPEAVA